MEKTLNSLNPMQSYLTPSEDYTRETSTFTFDFEKVATEIRKLRPELFYKVQSIVEKVYQGRGPGHHMMEKDTLRLESNKLAINTINALYEEEGINEQWIIDNLDEFTRCLMGTGCINASTSTKYSVHYFLYTKSLKNLGTERHKEYLYRAANLTDLGAFGMTELGHGSNVQSVETTAHYDHDTRSFILNSPTDTSIKFWLGNLAKTCSMLVTFAQLFLNGECKGVHVFLVPVRDKETHESFEGCLIGDCGDKLGLQGVDNGWIKFADYRIHKDMLLNKFCDINEEGEYVSAIPKDNKRFAYHMAALSGGRVLAASNGADISLISTITALRFAACRRQFSREKGKEETHILDYPLHQSRIMPLFAKSFTEMVSIQGIWDDYSKMSDQLLDPSNKAGEYFHLVSSALKAVVTWNSYETWKESRLSCGGFGFSFLNHFSELGNTADVNQTWEGENFVLIQQSCKILLKNFANMIRGKKTMKTCEFLTPDSPDDYIFEGSFLNLKDLFKLYTHHANKCVHESIAKIQADSMKEAEERLSRTEIWEKHLFYTFIPMVKIYLSRYTMEAYLHFLKKFKNSPKSKEVMTKVGLLGYLSEIIKFEGIFRESISKEQIDEIKEHCITLCKQLRPEIIGLTLAVPLSDKVFGSIGKSSMKPYYEFMKSVKETPGCFDKPKEWKYLYKSKI
ncbi:unnamed protein product [Moneuplotes crassus]|uniref:Acyl-coenzyme A oxidase n=1 Tax=Euplotes crassus TaxID=5936 RepID=A0AAD1Y9A9_EUPCR|nr:unnamed protein product [Moneuplotes crassus]